MEAFPGVTCQELSGSPKFAKKPVTVFPLVTGFFVTPFGLYESSSFPAPSGDVFASENNNIFDTHR